MTIAWRASGATSVGQTGLTLDIDDQRRRAERGEPFDCLEEPIARRVGGRGGEAEHRKIRA